MQHSLDAAWTSWSAGYLHTQTKTISLPALLLTPVFPYLFFVFSWGEPVEKKMPHAAPAAQFGTHGLSENGPSVLALISSVCCLWWSLGQVWRDIVLSLNPCLLLVVSPLPSGKRAGEDHLGRRCWYDTFSCPSPWEGVCNMLLFSSLLKAHSISAWEEYTGDKWCWNGIGIRSFQSCIFQTTPDKKVSPSPFGLEPSAITLAVLLLPGEGDKFGSHSGSGVQRDFLWHCLVEPPTEKHRGVSSPTIHPPPLHTSPAGEIQALQILFSNYHLFLSPRANFLFLPMMLLGKDLGAVFPEQN